MSRGGLMLRCVDNGLELDYVPIAGAVRQGKRPPRLVPAMKRRKDAFLRGKPRKALPHEFVLDALGPRRRSHGRCSAASPMYVKEKIVLILRDRSMRPPTTVCGWRRPSEHHDSLRREFPHMRSIGHVRDAGHHWQVLPADASDFEESAMHACELVLARDPRIGRVPARGGRSLRSRRRRETSAKKRMTNRAQQGPASVRQRPRRHGGRSGRQGVVEQPHAASESNARSPRCAAEAPLTTSHRWSPRSRSDHRPRCLAGQR